MFLKSDRKEKQICLVVDESWCVQHTSVVVESVKKSKLLSVPMSENETVAEIDFKPCLLVVNDLEEVVIPVRSGVVGRPLDVVHVLVSPTSMMGSNGILVLGVNVTDFLFQVFHVLVCHWLISQSGLFVGVVRLFLFSLWFWCWLRFVMAFEMDGVFIFSCKHFTTLMALV